eukprot:GHVH01017282.1.p1 GENE.GHVH01017282.1~~GHVH01017282.1.p1  ORF type:complete len:370 (+),score=71.16 GHVH01017282.1:252-1361(+)
MSLKETNSVYYRDALSKGYFRATNDSLIGLGPPIDVCYGAFGRRKYTSTAAVAVAPPSDLKVDEDNATTNLADTDATAEQEDETTIRADDSIHEQLLDYWGCIQSSSFCREGRKGNKVEIIVDKSVAWSFPSTVVLPDDSLHLKHFKSLSLPSRHRLGITTQHNDTIKVEKLIEYEESRCGRDIISDDERSGKDHSNSAEAGGSHSDDVEDIKRDNTVCEGSGALRGDELDKVFANVESTLAIEQPDEHAAQAAERRALKKKLKPVRRYNGKHHGPGKSYYEAFLKNERNWRLALGLEPTEEVVGGPCSSDLVEALMEYCNCKSKTIPTTVSTVKEEDDDLGGGGYCLVKDLLNPSGDEIQAFKLQLKK